MKISYEWLKELIDLPWSPEVTAEKLTEVGFPVEGMTRIGVSISNIVAAKILHIDKHPNADRLQVARVEDGQGERTVVCGAPNIAVGQVIPLALPGTKFPNGLEIVVSKIRGVESQGMLCSERELGLSDSHAGIMMLPLDAKLGTPVKDLLGSDVIFDMDVTPNRPDMLSHVGVARELAALSGLKLKKIASTEKPIATKTTVPVQIDQADLCSRYIAKIFSDVTVASSPEWMKKRLVACGIRSINNLVDITNYVLLEWGHPLHVFDVDQLQDKKLVVRLAKKGEKILALDEKTYELKETQLVIADGKNPVAIAGVMGGQLSGVTDKTKNVLLESAVFDRTSVRLTSKALALKSESSIRFEKGTDAETSEQASLRASQLIQELAQGKIESSQDVYPKKSNPISISISLPQIERLLGALIPAEYVETILSGLGFGITKNSEGFVCAVPAHRKDVFESADLIEEVARLYGYNRIPVREPLSSLGNIDDAQKTPDRTALIAQLRSMSLNETMSSSFSSVEMAKIFGFSEKDCVTLANPLSQEESILRPLVITNLLLAAQRNVNTQQENVKLFELGKTFFISADGKTDEKSSLAILLSGDQTNKTWQSTAEKFDFYSIKGLIETLNTNFNLQLEFVYTSPKAFLHPSQSFVLLKNKQEVGWAGVLHPALSAKFDLTRGGVVAELAADLFAVPLKRYQAFSKQPFVERDLAVLLAASTPWEKIEKVARRSGGELLKKIRPFDIFQSDKIGKDKKSLAFRMTFQHADKTLTDADINFVMNKITTSLKEACGAELR